MFLIALKTKYGNNDDSPWRGQVSTDPTIFDFGDEPITSIDVSISHVLLVSSPYHGKLQFIKEVTIKTCIT